MVISYSRNTKHIQQWDSYQKAIGKETCQNDSALWTEFRGIKGTFSEVEKNDRRTFDEGNRKQKFVLKMPIFILVGGE